MTSEEKARENWKAMYRLFGKKSKEEMEAYQEYIAISQGASKSKIKPRTVKTVSKVAQTLTLSLF